MSRFYPVRFVSLVAFFVNAALSCIAAGNSAQVFTSSSSSQITFETSTNVPGIDVSGKSKAVVATVEVLRNGNSLELRQIDATVPVQSLTTGMNLRDEHMKKYIFTTPDGRIPDVHFVAADGRCELKTCQIGGTLTIRDVSRPMSVTLTIKEATAESFTAKGDAVLKLSAFGIEAPSQLGVKTSDEVKVHLELALSDKPRSK